MSDCNSCPTNGQCGTEEKEACQVEFNANNQIKHVIGVMSGKGGVGKSTVATLVANELKQRGYSVGVMDADITGPSIPRLMQVQGQSPVQTTEGLFPVENAKGIKVMSLNLLMEDEDQPVIWRGPILGNVVKQFWTDVVWGELDYLVVDMPPGTGDVAITAMQNIPMSGVVMVSVPQDMVSMIVAKAVHMVRRMHKRVIGVVENMSYIECPDCGKEIRMYDAKTDRFRDDLQLNLLGALPMTMDVMQATQNGFSDNDPVLEKYAKPMVDEILKDLDQIIL
ncbi:Mrp/NBP35 family ATP-binding protein [Gottschalkiaceae bacterium SANA]|nr:Mrp/NBP35 family ATP-binding protein [Gottschalkiaceae bacterium SANA]